MCLIDGKLPAEALYDFTTNCVSYAFSMLHFYFHYCLISLLPLGTEHWIINLCQKQTKFSQLSGKSRTMVC